MKRHNAMYNESNLFQLSNYGDDGDDGGAGIDGSGDAGDVKKK
jgi:hypothetical protein